MGRVFGPIPLSFSAGICTSVALLFLGQALITAVHAEQATSTDEVASSTSSILGTEVASSTDPGLSDSESATSTASSTPYTAPSDSGTTTTFSSLEVLPRGGDTIGASSSMRVLNTPSLYAHDFSVDPGWETDQPELFFWDSDTEALRIHAENEPPEYVPNRYFALPVDLDTQQSFRVEVDVLIEDIDTAGGVTFGLYTHALQSGAANAAGYFATSTFNYSLFGLSKNRNYSLSVVDARGVDYGVGGIESQEFLLDTWYRISMEYDADESRASVAVTNLETEELYSSYEVDMSETFSSAMQYVGVAMHPQGEAGSIFAHPSRVSGSSDFLVDNVAVYGESLAVDSPPPDHDAASNVLFLPGFQGSFLYLESAVRENQLWTPFIDGDDVGKLGMSEAGDSIEDVYTREIIGDVAGLDLYRSFGEHLDRLVATGTIQSWEAFPYDWRQDVFDIIEDGTALAEEERAYPAEVLGELAEESGTGKVTIVAHSNGGLLAKALIDKLGEEGDESLVDRIVLIGSPQLGAPKTIGSMLHGYGQEVVFKEFYTVIFPSSARYISLNMPGVYTLLPAEGYLEEQTTPVVTFGEEEVVTPYRDAYGEGIETYEELQEFLVGQTDGRLSPDRDDTETPAILNAALLARAALNHEHFRAWEPPEDVEVISVVGVGLSTPEAFRYKQEERTECVLTIICETRKVLDYEVQMTLEGDGTVPALSAGYIGDVYYVDMRSFNESVGSNKRHAEMSGIEPITTLIERILTNESELPAYVSRELPDVSASGVRISTHSPVAFVVTDNEGRRSGVLVDEEGGREILQEIPNSYVIETAESIYVGLPDGSEVEVAISGKGAGTFALEVAQTNSVGEVTERVRYEDIVVTEETSAVLVIDEASAPASFVVDIDGDGAADIDVLEPSSDGSASEEEGNETSESSGGGSSRRDLAIARTDEQLLLRSDRGVVVSASELISAYSAVDGLYAAGQITEEQYRAFLEFFLWLRLSGSVLEELE